MLDKAAAGVVARVGCVMVASDDAIKSKRETLKELVYCIHKCLSKGANHRA